MKTQFKTVLFSALIGIATGLSVPSYADDTVFYRELTKTFDAANPNVMFLIDLSHTMGENVPNTTTPRIAVALEAVSALLRTTPNINAGFATFASKKDGTDAILGGTAPPLVNAPIRFPIADMSDLIKNYAGAALDDSVVDASIGNSSDDIEEHTAADATVTITMDGTELNPEGRNTSTGDTGDTASSTCTSGTYDADTDTCAVTANVSGGTTGWGSFILPNIPSNATINSATLSYTCNNGSNKCLSSNLDMIHLALNSAVQIADAIPGQWNKEGAGGDVKTVVITNGVQWLLGQGAVSSITVSHGGGTALADDKVKNPSLSLTYIYTPSVDSTPVASDDDGKRIGLRFENVNVPQSASAITNAYITFTSTRDTGVAEDTVASIAASTYDMTIAGEKTVNSVTFTNSTDDISSRTLTTSSVTSTVTGALAAGDTYQTADLTTVVQEIVAQGDTGSADGWCMTNAMTFVISADVNFPHNFASYDNDPTNAPVLHIEYDPAQVDDNACVRRSVALQISHSEDDAEQTLIRAGTDPDNNVFIDSNTLDLTTNSSSEDAGSGTTKREVGFRFRNVGVGRGNTIINAELTFTARGNSHCDPCDPNDPSDGYANTETSAPNLTITGEPNAMAFEAIVGNLTDRTKVGSTSWVPGEWLADQKYGVDVTSVVQAVVDDGGWSSGDSMGLYVTGTGLRQTYSIDGASSASQGASLAIEFVGTYAEHGGAKTVLEYIVEMLADDTFSYTGGYKSTVAGLHEVARYFLGSDVTYGRHRADELSADSDYPNEGEHRRVSFLDTYNDGYPSRDTGCTEANLSATACVTEQILDGCDPNPDTSVDSTTSGGECSSGGGSSSARSTTCDADTAVYVPPDPGCGQNYLILITDGIPDRIPNGAVSGSEGLDDFAEIVGSSSCSGSGAEQCAADLTKYMNGMFDVITHTIGVGVTDSNTEDFLADVAAAGGGSFEAVTDDVAGLIQSLEELIVPELFESSSFALPGLSINAFNKLFHNNEIFVSMFQPLGDRIRWEGNVKKYKLSDGSIADLELGEAIDKNNAPVLDPNSEIGGKINPVAADFWSNASSGDGGRITRGGAGNQIPAPDSRNIYTYKDGAMVKFDATTPNYTEVGIVDSSEYTAEQIFNWILGYDVLDEDRDNDTTDLRPWTFGDPLHGSPRAITYGVDNIKVFVATNDGGLRMLDGETGQEDWMFIPQELMSIQATLMANPKQDDRVFGLDGTPAFIIDDQNYDSTIDSGDSVKLFVGMRRGGRNIYGLDVTDISTPQPVLLWTIKGGTNTAMGDYSKLGQTWSFPRPARILWPDGGNTSFASKQVLLFGGGYDTALDETETTGGTPTKGNAIYMVDASNGHLIWSASNSSSASITLPNMTYPIPSDLAVMDSVGDGYSDRIYVGDTRGQVWRIDLVLNSTGKADGYTGSAEGMGIGGVLASLAENTVSGDRRFFYPPDVVRLTDYRYLDRGLFDAISITSGDRANTLERVTVNQFYSLRDRAVDGLSDDENNVGVAVQNDEGSSNYDDTKAMFFTLTQADLHNSTETPLDVDTDVVGDSDPPKGWYMDLPGEGEKGLSQPLALAGKLYFTTFMPPPIEVFSNPTEDDTLDNATPEDMLASETELCNIDESWVKRDRRTCEIKQVMVCHVPPGSTEGASERYVGISAVGMSAGGCAGGASGLVILGTTGGHIRNGEGRHGVEGHRDCLGPCPDDGVCTTLPPAPTTSSCETSEFIEQDLGTQYVFDSETGAGATTTVTNEDGTTSEVPQTMKMGGTTIVSSPQPVFHAGTGTNPGNITVQTDLESFNPGVTVARDQVFWVQQ